MEYITTFSQLKKYWAKSKKVALRNYARESALDLICLKENFENYHLFFSKPRVHFLYIHHIFKDEEKNFDLLVKKLSEQHTFISHSEAVKKLLDGKVDRPYVTFSSDDGLKSNLKAAEILNRYGAKACFFVNPNSIGIKTIEKAAEFCKTRLDMPPTEFLSWNDLKTLIKQGHEIGAHTMNHEDVSKLTLPEFEENLNDCKRILSAECGDISHFAYTYGGLTNFNKKAFDLVFQMDYQSCSTAVRGCHISDGTIIKKENLLIRREHIVGAWKVNHMLYFIKKSIENAKHRDNYPPIDWN